MPAAARWIVPLVSILLLASGRSFARPLVVYSPHGPEILKRAQADFQKLFPETKVDWRFLGAEEIFEALGREAKQPVADVWWGGPNFTFMNAAKNGLLSPYKPTWAAAVDGNKHDPADLWYADLQTPLTILYQKNLIGTADLPKDWDDLLAPAFKGKIILRYPLESGSMRALFATLIDRQIRAGKTLPGALDWMKKLEDQVARYVNHSQLMFSTVGKGVMPISLWNVSDIEMKAHQGYPVDFVFPASGMPVLLDGVGLVKRAEPHPFAEKFYEFVTSKDFEATVSGEPYFRVPTRNDLGAVNPKYMTDPRFKVMPVDWSRIAESGAAWLKAWETDVFRREKLLP